MENIKINTEDYPNYLEDIYYSLLTIVGRYANQNFDVMESLTNEQSDYAKAIITGKGAIKELLDLFTANDELVLSSTGECVKISELTYDQQLRVIEQCKEYIIKSMNTINEQKGRSL